MEEKMSGSTVSLEEIDRKAIIDNFFRLQEIETSSGLFDRYVNIYLLNRPSLSFSPNQQLGLKNMQLLDPESSSTQEKIIGVLKKAVCFNYTVQKPTQAWLHYLNERGFLLSSSSRANIHGQSLLEEEKQQPYPDWVKTADALRTLKRQYFRLFIRYIQAIHSQQLIEFKEGRKKILADLNLPVEKTLQNRALHERVKDLVIRKICLRCL